MITFKQQGSFNSTEKFLSKMNTFDINEILIKHGEDGVRALAAATPVETGKTANSWSYEIGTEGKNPTLYFKNESINNGVNIAIVLQYGHGTRNGGYVEGRDYINPALRPVFDDILNDLWREVTN